MLVLDDYCLSYDKERNKITITLPQTWKTMLNTVDELRIRRVDVKEEDLFAVLLAAKYIFEYGAGIYHERTGQTAEDAARGKDTV